MNTQPSIVVGFDGTPQSVTALVWALEEAARTELPLRIVHVWEQPVSDGYVGLVTAGAAEETALSWAKAGVQEALGASALPAGSVVVARPWSAGTGAGERGEGACAPRPGNGRAPRPAPAGRGSVSHYCVAHAPVPVVTVPMAREAVPAGRPEAPSRASAPQAFGPLL
jgi:nucleotide-binding universal stress UspA family protein